MNYVWKAQNYKVPAAIVGEIVARIEKKEGLCHPAKLVDAARPISSPIHDLFEWDDQEAAERYRIEQARGVLQAIRVVFKEGGPALPAFVHVRWENEPGYGSSIRVMANSELRQQVIEDALAQIDALKDRYRNIMELQEIWKASDKVKQKLKKEPEKAQ